MADKKDRNTRIIMFVLTALAALFFLEAVRELVGAVYNLNLATMGINISIVAILAYFAPIVYRFYHPKRTVRLLGLTGIIGVAFRLLMATDPVIELYLLYCAGTVVAFALFLPLLLRIVLDLHQTSTLTTILRPGGSTHALVLGAALDLMFRAFGDTFSITIYGLSPTRATALIYLAVPAAFFLIALLAYLCRSPAAAFDAEAATETETESESESVTEGVDMDVDMDVDVGVDMDVDMDDGTAIGHTPVPPKRFAPLYGAGFGALGVLYLSLLGYPNNIARWIGASYRGTLIIVCGAFAALLCATLVPRLRALLGSQFAAELGNILLLAAFIFLTVIPNATVALILVAASLFFFPILLAHALRVMFRPAYDAKYTGGFFIGASAAFVLFLVFSVFTLTWAHVGLAFLRGRIDTILLVALFVQILAFSLARPRRPITGRHHTHTERVSAAPTGGIAKVLALVAVAVLVVTPIVALAAYPAPAPDRPELDERPLRVMSYNIHQGYDTQGKIDPYEILAPIQEIDPDILSLQESDGNRISSTNVDLVQWLAHKLDMYVYFGPDSSEMIYGVALLSKFPLEKTETYTLTSVEDQRVLVRGDMVIHGELVSVYAIHMGLSVEDRTTQAEEIVDYIDANPHPALIMGDFNTQPNETQYATLDRTLIDTWREANPAASNESGYTFDSVEPYQRIDYIWRTPDLGNAATHCAVMFDEHGSDHLPLWAEIAFTS